MVELTDAEVRECLMDAGIKDNLRPPYNHLGPKQIQKNLKQLVNKNKHIALLNRVIAHVERKSTSEDRKQKRLNSYKIVLRVLGVMEVDSVKIDIRTRNNGRHKVFHTKFSIIKHASRQEKPESYGTFLKFYAQPLIYDNRQRASSAIPASTPSQRSVTSSAASRRRRDDGASGSHCRSPVSATVPGSASHGGTNPAYADLNAVICTITNRLQPLLDKQIKAPMSNQHPASDFFADILSACKELRIPERQEVRNVMIGHNGIGKSTAIDVCLQATEVSAAEYASNITVFPGMDSEDIILKPEWDVLSLHIGKKAASLLSKEELMTELKTALGRKVTEPASSWRVQLPVPNAADVQQACDDLRQRFSNYLQSPTSIYGSYILPVGNNAGVTTMMTMELKFCERYARLLRFPTEEDMQKRALQYVIGIQELKDAKEKEATGVRVVRNKDATDNLKMWWGDYCAVVKECVNDVSARKFSGLSLEEVNAFVEEIKEDLHRDELPCEYEEGCLPLCEGAKRLAKHRYDIRYTGGTQGRDSDRVALQNELALLNSVFELHQYGSDTPEGRNMIDYFRMSKLCDLCIVYGPWNVLKDGIVFVDTCGLGDIDPAHGRQKQIILGPVDQGGAEVVTALVEKNMSASATVFDLLGGCEGSNNSIVTDSLDGLKLLLVGRFGEKWDMAPIYGKNRNKWWYETTVGIEKRVKMFPEVRQEIEQRLAQIIDKKEWPGPIPPLNLSWILFFSALREPSWFPQAENNEQCTREAMLSATYMREYFGVSEFLLLKKTREEVKVCLGNFEDACRMLNNLKSPKIRLTKQQRQAFNGPSNWAEGGAPDVQQLTDDDDGETQNEVCRQRIDGMVNFIMCQGGDQDEELEELMPRLKEEVASLSKRCCDKLLRKQASTGGGDSRQLQDRSLKAALTGGCFTYYEYPSQGKQPQKTQCTLADFLFEHENGNDVGEIAGGIEEYMGNMFDDAVPHERQRCKDKLLHRIERLILSRMRENGVSDAVVYDEMKKLHLLVDCYLAAKEKRFLYDAIRLAKPARHHSNFGEIGREAYRDAVRGHKWMAKQIKDRDVRKWVTEVIKSARQAWMKNLKDRLIKLWDETTTTLSDNAQKLVHDFGSWKSDANHGEIEITLSQVKDLVEKVKNDLTALKNQLDKQVNEAKINTEDGLVQQSATLISKLARESQLAAVCDDADDDAAVCDDRVLSLPNKAAIDIGSLDVGNIFMALRSATFIDATLDPTDRLRIVKLEEQLKNAKFFDAASGSRVNILRYAELSKEDSDVKPHTLAQGLYQACYQHKPRDLSGANALQTRLEMCEKIWFAAWRQARRTEHEEAGRQQAITSEGATTGTLLLQGLIVWCHVHGVDVLLCSPLKALYIKGSPGLEGEAYVLFAEQHSGSGGGIPGSFDFYAAAPMAAEESRGRRSRPSRSRKRKSDGKAATSWSTTQQNVAVPGAEVAGVAGGSTTVASTNTTFLSPDDVISQHGTKKFKLEVRRQDCAGRAYYEVTIQHPMTRQDACVISYPYEEGRHAYFRECVSYQLPMASKDENPVTGLAGEDSHSSSFCHLALMDGVTGENTDDPLAYRDGSGRKAEWLAEACKKVAMPLALSEPLPGANYNRSYSVLKEASDAVREHVQRDGVNNDPKYGSTTALVASTCMAYLHVASLGDCRLAVLRKDDKQGGLRVKYLSRPTTFPPPSDSVPVQIKLDRSDELEGFRAQHRPHITVERIAVQEGDLVVAGTDGFFENLKYDEYEGRDAEEKIRPCLEELCDEAAGEFDTVVETLSQRIGLSLYSKARQVMHHGPRASRQEPFIPGHHAKPDDLTLLVARISFKHVAAITEVPPHMVTKFHPLMNVAEEVQPRRRTRQYRFPNLEGECKSWHFQDGHAE